MEAKKNKPNKLVFIIFALWKVGSLKSSGSGSTTCKLLERVSHFSRRACSTVYPAPSSLPPSLFLFFHSLCLFFTLGTESLLALWKLFLSPHQLSIAINWVFRARGGDSLHSGGTTAADYFHLLTPSEVRPPLLCMRSVSEELLNKAASTHVG